MASSPSSSSTFESTASSQDDIDPIIRPPPRQYNTPGREPGRGGPGRGRSFDGGRGGGGRGSTMGGRGGPGRGPEGRGRFGPEGRGGRGGRGGPEGRGGRGQPYGRAGEFQILPLIANSFTMFISHNR